MQVRNGQVKTFGGTIYFAVDGTYKYNKSCGKSMIVIFDIFFESKFNDEN